MKKENNIISQEFPLLVRRAGLGKKECLKKDGSLLITLDTQSNLFRFPGLANKALPLVAISEYEQKVTDAMQLAYGGVSPVVVTQEEAFYENMTQIMEEAVVKGKEIGARVVNLDRFVNSPNLRTGVDYSNISVGRTITSNGVVIGERPGEIKLELQLENLKREMAENGQTSIIIVDDGLFDIECLNTYEGIFADIDIAGYYVGVGLYGDGDLNTVPYLESQGKIVKSLIPIKNPLDWICSRDFAPWGGKIAQTDNGEFLTIPYFAPFSDGSGASIPSERLIPVSRALLSANLSLFRELEKVQGYPFTFADFVQAGYGLPASNINMGRRAEREDSVTNYLAECLIELDSNYPISNLGNALSEKPAASANLESLNEFYGDKLVILVGSSGTGRSTIARELTKSYGVTRLARVTTRNLRSAKETDEIKPISREEFLQNYANGECQNPIITAVRYAANDQFYGVDLGTLQKLKEVSQNQYGVIEGTGDVLALKQILPKAKVVMVLPPSLESVDQRLTSREEVDKQVRLIQTEREVTETIRLLPKLIQAGLVDLVVTNEDLANSVDTIVKYLIERNS